MMETTFLYETSGDFDILDDEDLHFASDIRIFHGESPVCL